MCSSSVAPCSAEEVRDTVSIARATSSLPACTRSRTFSTSSRAPPTFPICGMIEFRQYASYFIAFVGNSPHRRRVFAKAFTPTTRSGRRKSGRSLKGVLLAFGDYSRPNCGTQRRSRTSEHSAVGRTHRRFSRAINVPTRRPCARRSRAALHERSPAERIETMPENDIAPSRPKPLRGNAMGHRGVEPRTSRLSGVRSNHLS